MRDSRRNIKDPEAAPGEGEPGGLAVPALAHRTGSGHAGRRDQRADRRAPALPLGRSESVHDSGRDEILGTAYSDHDLVVFLEGAGVADPEAVLDDPLWVEWRGGPAHEFSDA
ncbi:hypothetical protein GCM10023084_80570 [Streptomyces lacrimifluminis]|uniref:Uncharacterized protein n=1 Tax=Streptomyces lacrimifluminis TaxID=1500077 RepID=A0A917UNR3_9ACTN|nr:hypothetical protein GCM10012282_79790 [Streptomyces lacrimifluminis]